MTQAPLSVIVKTWHSGEYTRACLASIAEAPTRPADVVVVDLGDDDDTEGFARALLPSAGVDLVWLPLNRRLAPGPANRLALEHASAPTVALLDNDIVVPTNWLDRLLPQLEHTNAGLVAPARPTPALRYPGRDASTQTVLQRLVADTQPSGPAQPDTIVSVFTEGAGLEALGRAVQAENDIPKRERVGFPAFLSSCCLLARRSTIAAAGGIARPEFDAGYGSEDVDLSWRVLDLGLDLIQCNEVFVAHFRNASLRRNRVDVESELRVANQTLYALWRAPLLAWVEAQLESGTSPEQIASEFILRELAQRAVLCADLAARPSTSIVATLLEQSSLDR
ncbi:MAG: glycosyltransferase family 2 protein [Chloroflexi bacterium]|nr:glycosyltransferase family 2 protein [Chloroflexota bacterium]